MAEVPASIESFCAHLDAALRREYGTPSFPPVGDYVFAAVGPRHFMRYVPVASFTRGGDTIAFIVTTTDPAERVYKRSARYDIVYFSEDVADDDQHIIYARDRSMIDAFCAWLVAWDPRDAAENP